MQIDWNGMSTGRKVMVVCAAVALVSFFLPWAKAHPLRAHTFNGFSIGWPLIGLGLLVSGAFMALKGGGKKMIFVGLGVAAAAVGIVFAATETWGTVKVVNVSQWGSYVYIVSALGFTVGPFLDPDE